MFNENGIPPEYRQFYSSDPYEVLGVPIGATESESKAAMRLLNQKYHPDVNTDPLATEITKRINGAYAVLRKRRVAGGFDSSHDDRPRPASREESRYRQSPPYTGHEERRNTGQAHTRREERQDPQSEAEKHLFRVLEMGAKIFKRRIVDPIGSDHQKEKELMDFFQSERVRKYFRDSLIGEIQLWAWDRPERIGEYMDEWSSTRFDFKAIVGSPEVRKELVRIASRVISNNHMIIGSRITRQLEFWSEYGVDFSADLCAEFSTAENKNLLHDKINTAIIVDCTIDTRDFVEFIESWKTIGLDLGYSVNLPRSQESIALNVEYLAAIKNSSVKSYVEAWLKAGWIPSEEIKARLKGIYTF
ncbi:MAG: J domain-containing protein [Patescibacteria group bacterium]